MATFWRNLAPAARSLSRLPRRCSRACNETRAGVRSHQAARRFRHRERFRRTDGKDSDHQRRPGPAAIKAVTFYVDRKPVAEADEWGERTPSCRRPGSNTKSWSRVTRWRSGRRYGCHRRPPAAWGAAQESDNGRYRKCAGSPVGPTPQHLETIGRRLWPANGRHDRPTPTPQHPPARPHRALTSTPTNLECLRGFIWKIAILPAAL